MTEEILQFILLTFGSTLLLALTPTRHLQWGIAIIGSAAILSFAPISFAWNIALTLLAWAIMRFSKIRFAAIAPFLCLSTLLLLVLREQSWLTALGAAYFTLRIMHVVLDWWMERLRAPALLPLLSYALFVPTFLAGPIHRYPNFERQLARRRVTAPAVIRGLERVLLGLFSLVVLGGWIVQKAQSVMQAAWGQAEPFAVDWAMSALGWVELYFAFGGLSAVAIGCALIIGITIEENFDHPYRARNLVEFWSRWHMSLTSWCRDYIFSPVSASLRSPVLGVFAAMLVLGLWHESSLYYILWSTWQAAGIVLSRVARPIFANIPDSIDRVISPFLILGWLSLAKPVVNRLLDGVQ